MDTFLVLEKVNRMLLDEFAIVNKAVPAYWISFFLLICAAGEQGVTAHDVAHKVGMLQGRASRLVGLLSKRYNKDTKKMEGLGLITVVPDHIDLHRHRLFLTEAGKRVAKKIEEYLS